MIKPLARAQLLRSTDQFAVEAVLIDGCAEPIRYRLDYDGGMVWWQHVCCGYVSDWSAGINWTRDLSDAEMHAHLTRIITEHHRQLDA